MFQIFYQNNQYSDFGSEVTSLRKAKKLVKETLSLNEAYTSAIIFKEGIPHLFYKDNQWKPIYDYN